jgi:hypothetical protein
MVGAATTPFVGGFFIVVVVWLLGRHVFDPIGPLGWAMRFTRWLYVMGHELTHAMAAWSTGGKVYAIHVEESGGHVDLSESSVFVALAPYCVPFHALLVVIGYRLVLWWNPTLQAESLFLLLMGMALAFHALMTWETLTQTKQPDLEAAGGTVFSWALIATANGVCVLLVLKTLFPETVYLGRAFRQSGANAWFFWTGAWKLVFPAAKNFWRFVWG